ncbi:MAG: ABC transporter substrate-binding protein [Lachnospiraceae bacterium]|nr:ABC transporter substrate-binding protein [Lachnospiraceae bacterium]
MKRIGSGMLAMLLLIGVCMSWAGCGKEGSKKEEPYQITMMHLVSTDQAEEALVEQALDELARKEINMSVKLIPVSLGSLAQTQQLMFSGGEALDIVPIFVMYVAGYLSNGYLVDLSEYLDKEHAPGIIEWFGSVEEASVGNIGGFVYGIPTQKEITHPGGIVMRKDMLEAAEIEADTIQSWADLTNVYEKVQPLYPNMDMLVGNKSGSPCITLITSWCDFLSDYFGVVMMKENTEPVVTNLYESDVYRNMAELVWGWHEAGYVQKDMSTATDGPEAMIRAGKGFSFITQTKPGTKEEKDAATGYETVVIPLEEPIVSSTTAARSTYGIVQNSKDPGKAMEFLDWLFTSKEANNLLNWGVEGTHFVYRDQEKNIIGYPEGVDVGSVGYHIGMGFCMPNQFVAGIWEGNPADIWEQTRAFNQSAEKSPVYGFMWDSAGYENQITALNAVLAEYEAAISCGMVDPAVYLPEMNKALYDAGLQEIMDAKQKQIEEWLSAK